MTHPCPRHLSFLTAAALLAGGCASPRAAAKPATPAPAVSGARAAPAPATAPAAKQAAPTPPAPIVRGELPTLVLDPGGRIITMQGAPARIVIPDGWHVLERSPRRLVFARSPVAGEVRPVIEVTVTAASAPADVPSVVHRVVAAAFGLLTHGDTSRLALPSGWNGGALGKIGVSGQGKVKFDGTAYETRWRYFEAHGGNARLAIAGACPARGPDACDQAFASVASSFLTNALGD